MLLTAALVTSLGIVTTASANSGHVELATSLSGAEEVPPADADGTGRATLDIFTETNQVCWAVEFRRIGTPNRAHIHVGPAGSNGPIVVTLFDIVLPDPANPLHDQLERGRAKGCSTADPATIAAIVANPSGYYVNLHVDPVTFTSVLIGFLG
jgi:hypothetical protein